jgi:hypothetical protein
MQAQLPLDTTPGCYVACLEQQPAGGEYTFCSSANPFVLIGSGNSSAACLSRSLAAGAHSSELYFAGAVVGDVDFPDCESCVPMNTTGHEGTLVLVLHQNQTDGALNVVYSNLLLSTTGPTLLRNMQATVSGMVLSGSMGGGASWRPLLNSPVFSHVVAYQLGS